MTNYFMPSEVARLILGYLIERGLQKTLTTFLQECSDLTEFYQLMRAGRAPPITVLGQSLLDILNEFAELKLKAVRSGQLTVQPTNTIDGNNAAPRVLAQSREQAEKIIQHKRVGWKERKSRSRTKSRKAREDRAQTGVTGGDQDIASTSISASNHVTLPESISISTPNHATDLGSTGAVTAVVTAVDDVEEVPIASDNVSHLLPPSSGATIDTGTREDAQVSKPGPEPSATTRRNEDETTDFLDLLLEETHFHEKLAENINKALLECGSSCVVGNRVDAAVQQTLISLDKDKMGKCAAEVLNKDQASMVNRGLNINQIIQMTESDPSFQNFLQLFQQGTAIPISHFDVPVVTLSSELPGQPSCVSDSPTPLKDATSQCTSHKGLPTESAGHQDSALPLCTSSSPSTDISPADITDNSLPTFFKGDDSPKSPSVFNKCSAEVTKTSNNNSLPVSRPDHHKGTHSNKDISICQENLSDSADFSASTFCKDVKIKKTTDVSVSSSHQMRPFTCSDECSIASHLHCAQFSVEDQASMQGKKSADTHSMQSSFPKASTVIPVCPDKVTRPAESSILDDNSLTAFSLIEKSVAEMTGEKFVHRSLRNSLQFKALDPAESSHCDHERDNRKNEGVSASSEKTSMTLKDSHISSLPSQDNSLTCGNQQKRFEISSHCVETNSEIVSLVSKGAVCVHAAEIVSSCEDISAEKNSGEDNTKRNKKFRDKIITSTNNTSKSISPEAKVPSNINVQVTLSETEYNKNVTASELSTHPNGCDKASYLNDDRVNTNCLSSTLHFEKLGAIDKSVQDLLPVLSSQEKVNEPSPRVNSRQRENRFAVGTLQQNHDRVGKDGHSICSSPEKTFPAVVMPIDKSDRQERKNISCHEKDEQASGGAFHSSVVLPLGHTRQNNPSTEESGSLHDVNPQKSEDNNSQVKYKHCCSMTGSRDTEKENPHSRNCDPNSSFVTGCSVVREIAMLPVEKGLLIPEQTDNSATLINLPHPELKRHNHGTVGISQMQEKSHRFESAFASCSNINKQPGSKRSQSLSDFSFSKIHLGHHEQTKQGAIKLSSQRSIVGSPPYYPMAAANSNSPQKLPANINSHNTCFSLPANFGSEVACDSPFSQSQKLTHNSLLKQTQPNRQTHSNLLQGSSFGENHPHNKAFKRKVIAVHSEHAPFIPHHCKKNPSRRIAPTEVDYSTPSPLQDFPSSPMNYVVDVYPPHLTSPFRETEGISRQLSVGKCMLSPTEHVKVSSQRTRTPSYPGSSNTLCRAQSKPCGEQLEEKVPRGSISQLEQLGIKLPPSPSRRKPRRVKPVQLSSAVDTGWSSLIRSSPCATQDTSSPVLDDAKVVCSTSDVFTSSTEAKAFRMLKSFLASSYSKPQPRQEITSTDQAAPVSDKIILKHYKGKGEKNAAKDNLSDDHHDHNSETSKRNIDVYASNEWDAQKGAYCQVETALANEKLRTDESRSVEEWPRNNKCPVEDLPVKNCLNQDLYTESHAPSTSPPSDDGEKSFAAVGLMECYSKEGYKQGQIKEKCRSAVQTTCSLPQIHVCENIQSVSLVKKLEHKSCDQLIDKPSKSDTSVSKSNNKHGVFEILNKILEDTEENNALGFKMCRHHSVVDSGSSIPQQLPINHGDKIQSADITEGQFVQIENRHKISSDDKVARIVAEEAAGTADATHEAEKVKPPTLAPVIVGVKNVPSACKSSCQASTSYPSPLSLSGVPCTRADTSAVKLLTQEEATFAVPKHNSSEQSCNKHQLKISDSCGNVSALINAPNPLSNISCGTAVAVVNSSQSISPEVADESKLTTPGDIPLPDENSMFNTNYLAPTFDDINNSMPYLSSKPVNKPADGPYTALLNAPVTSSDVNLTGVLSSSLRLAYNIEPPSDMTTSSLSSPVKHCSWGRQDVKGFTQDLCEGNNNNITLRPGSPCSRSLLSTAMANCGIPFEGSNLTMPQTFVEQNQSLWQETPAPQIQTLDCSPSTSAQKNKSRIGRKPQSKAQKPGYKNVSNILPRLGAHNWNTTEVAAEQPLVQPHNYSSILPKPLEMQNTVLKPQAVDSSTLLCQIQVIPSVNGPVIIIPPGHESILQKFLSECEATNSQRILPQSPLHSNLPISNPCTPHDNMRPPQGYSSKSSLPISCHPSLSCSDQKSPAMSQTDKLQCHVHVEAINPRTGKGSKENSSSKNISNPTSESTADINVHNEKDSRQHNSSPKQNEEQLTRASKTMSLRKIAVKRKIDFTQLRTLKSKNSKSNRKKTTQANVNGKADSSVNGKADSSVNGKADSSVNGKADSSVNGKADSNVNGKADSSVNGKADSSVNGKADSTAEQGCHDIVTPDVNSVGTHLPICSQASCVTLCEQNMECEVQQIQNLAELGVRTGLKEGKISKQGKYKISSSEKLQKDNKVVATVTKSVPKTNNRRRHNVGDKDINETESFKNKRASSVGRASILSELLRFKISPKKTKSKKCDKRQTKNLNSSTLPETAKKGKSKSVGDCSKSRKDKTVLSPSTKSKSVGDCGKSGKDKTVLSPSTKSKSVGDSGKSPSTKSKSVGDSGKSPSTKSKSAGDCGKSGKDKTVLSPSTKHNKSSTSHRSSTPVASSTPSNKRKRKAKQTDQDANQMSPIRPTKIRKLSELSEENQHIFSSKKSVRLFEDCISGKAIELGTVLGKNSDKCGISNKDKLIEEPVILETNSLQQKSENKPVLKTAGRKKDILACKKSCKVIDTEVENPKSSNLKSAANASTSLKLDKVCQYIGAMPMHSFQSIFDLQPKTQVKKQSCVKIGNNTQNRTGCPEREYESITAVASKAPDNATTTSRGRRALSLTKIDHPRENLFDAIRDQAVQNRTQNSETNTGLNVDSTSAKICDETESAVASLELCMREENNKGLYYNNTEFQHLRKGSSAKNVDHPPFDSLQENVLWTHHLPVTGSPVKQPNCYNNLTEVSPMKLHLPPKKRLSSDFVLTGKADLQNQSNNNSQLIPPERTLAFVDKKTECSSHIPSMLPSQQLAHPSTSVTLGADLPSQQLAHPSTSVTLGADLPSQQLAYPSTSVTLGADLPSQQLAHPSTSVTLGADLPSQQLAYPSTSVTLGADLPSQQLAYPSTSVTLGADLPSQQLPHPSTSVTLGADLPSQQLPHPFTSVTLGADLQAVAVQHVPSTLVNVIQSGHCSPLSDQYSSHQVDPELPLSKTEATSVHFSAPMLQKTLFSAAVLEVPSIQPLIDSSHCDSSRNNSSLTEINSPSHSSLNLQHEQRLSASPSPVVSTSQHSSPHGDKFQINDKQTLGLSSVGEHGVPACTVKNFASPFTESRVDKLLKKLHKKKKK